MTEHTVKTNALKRKAGEALPKPQFKAGKVLSRREPSLNRAQHEDRHLLVRGRTFRDPLHGNIILQNVVARLVDTCEFQRLAGLKQLGTSDYVYRGAVHSRFEHSVGVAHLAERMCRGLQEHQPELGITEIDIICVKIAGLCHDLGHGPFSHCWDGTFVQRLGVKWRHEEGSVDMLRHLLKQNGIDLREHGLGDADVAFIEEQILGTPLEERRGRPGHDKEYLYDIVNNTWSGLDVDKLDYLQRDAERAGISGSIKTDRFIELARVAWALDESGRRRKTICFPRKMCGEALDVFATRFRLHRLLYQHRAAKQVELMLVDALLLAEPHFAMLGSVDKDHPDGRWRLSECTNDMTAFTKLKDSVVDMILNDPNPLLEPSKALIRRVLRRQLYVCVGRTQYDPRPANKDEEQVKQEIIAVWERQQRSAARRLFAGGGANGSTGGGSGAAPAAAAAAAVEEESEDESRPLSMFAEDSDAEGDATEPDTDNEGAGTTGISPAAAAGGSGGSTGGSVAGLTADDMVVEFMVIHHGQGSKNPVDRMRFFGKFDVRDANAKAGGGEAEGQQISSGSYSECLPMFFEVRFVRVFCRNPNLADAVRDAFVAWCSETARCPAPLSQAP